MECNAKPYDGSEPRTVIIHVSDDDPIVFPFVERLYKNGLRIWHDSDIRKVMVEYKKNWKKQQASCSCFLVYLTENAVNSHVFRERLTSAVESGKPLVIINTISLDTLSPGMKLQIEKAIELIQSSYIPKEKLAEEIVNLPSLKMCLGKANPEISVSAYPNGQTNQGKASPVSQERSIAPSDRTMLELHGVRNQENSMQEVREPEKTNPLEINEKKPEASGTNKGTNASLEETIPLTKSDSSVTVDPDVTFIPQKIELPIIISLMSGEKKKGILGESVVGRTKKIQGAMADISFTDECKLFSGKHFALFYIDNMCLLICKHPNGMTVNGQEMQEGDKFTVDSEAIIQIPSNTTLLQLEKKVQPSYLMVATGARSKDLWDAKAIAFLQSKETGETRCFTDRFSFGRGNAWNTGVMASRNISRDHGTIYLDSGHFLFQDHSTNGTLINGSKINNESLELSNNDIISVQGNDQGEESFIFHYCFFEGEEETK